ncbi:MAG: competence/damage-inducible protein A, partial [Lachnospiraceae bacterium]|nr:competence/damage-inducible protein A [Lachnospiraceae bacterium]
MTVEIICVGTELLMGTVVNTNAAFIAHRCVALGLDCFYQCVVGDNAARLEAAIRMACDRSDTVILSGGLGPTEDDLTKETAAKVMGKELIPDEKAWK